MARRYRRKRNGGRKKGIRIGATAGMIVGVYQLYKTVTAAPPASKANWAIQSLTGFDPATGQWNWKDAKAAIPMIAGVGLSLVASKVGLNRYTPRGINI